MLVQSSVVLVPIVASLIPSVVATVATPLVIIPVATVVIAVMELLLWGSSPGYRPIFIIIGPVLIPLLLAVTAPALLPALLKPWIPVDPDDPLPQLGMGDVLDGQPGLLMRRKSTICK